MRDNIEFGFEIGVLKSPKGSAGKKRQKTWIKQFKLSIVIMGILYDEDLARKLRELLEGGYVRKSHIDRIIASNFKTLLQDLVAGKVFYISGNGKLIGGNSRCNRSLISWSKVTLTSLPVCLWLTGTQMDGLLQTELRTLLLQFLPQDLVWQKLNSTYVPLCWCCWESKT